MSYSRASPVLKSPERSEYTAAANEKMERALENNAYNTVRAEDIRTYLQTKGSLAISSRKKNELWSDALKIYEEDKCKGQDVDDEGNCEYNYSPPPAATSPRLMPARHKPAAPLVPVLKPAIKPPLTSNCSPAPPVDPANFKPPVHNRGNETPSLGGQGRGPLRNGAKKEKNKPPPVEVYTAPPPYDIAVHHDAERRQLRVAGRDALRLAENLYQLGGEVSGDDAGGECYWLPADKRKEVLELISESVTPRSLEKTQPNGSNSYVLMLVEPREHYLAFDVIGVYPTQEEGERYLLFSWARWTKGLDRLDWSPAELRSLTDSIVATAALNRGGLLLVRASQGV